MHHFFYLDCEGTLTLSSDNHNFVLPIHSSKFQNTLKKRRKLRARHPTTKRILSFDIVTMTGNCFWKVWNDYYFGSPYNLSTAGEHNPGWVIRSIELYDEDT